MAMETSQPSPDRWRRKNLLFGSGIAVLALTAVLTAKARWSPKTESGVTYAISHEDLTVTVTAQGLLESEQNTEIKCKVRGWNTIIWIIDSGTFVEPGDVLVRMDSLFIEEQIDERTKYAHWSRSGAEHSKAQVVSSELALAEYERGTYVAERMKLEKDLTIAKSALVSARNMLQHARIMRKSRYISQIEVEQREFAVRQAELDVELKETELEVLRKFTKAEQLQLLNGELAASKATHQANVERAVADASRQERALDEYQHCVIKAERAGLVIHRSAAEWEVEPLAEGSTVHKEQVLLLMPDLSRMRVKVGVHESVIDRMKLGLKAKVILPDETLTGEISEIATVTTPSGWWTGNEVKYDTFVKLPARKGLRPGTSAEVEILVAHYEDVLTIPVAAIVQQGESHYCYVNTSTGPEKRHITVGDTNDVFTIVRAGLKEGDQVLLRPPIADTAAEKPVENGQKPQK
jgi:multidrug efflux pump subunit AcrA (membrane-fusion protein)